MALQKMLSWDDLHKKFLQYAATAKEHEHQTLAMVNMLLDIAKTHEGRLTATELAEIYRFVLRVIGEECSDYEEDENEE